MPAASAGSATPRMPTRTPPMVSSRDGVTFLARERLLAMRSGATTVERDMMSVSASPAANGGPMCPSASPRKAARAAFACCSLGVLLSGKDSPPPSTSSTGPARIAARTSAA